MVCAAGFPFSPIPDPRSHYGAFLQGCLVGHSSRLVCLSTFREFREKGRFIAYNEHREITHLLQGRGRLAAAPQQSGEVVHRIKKKKMLLRDAMLEGDVLRHRRGCGHLVLEVYSETVRGTSLPGLPR